MPIYIGGIGQGRTTLYYVQSVESSKVVDNDSSVSGAERKNWHFSNR